MISLKEIYRRIWEATFPWHKFDEPSGKSKGSSDTWSKRSKPVPSAGSTFKKSSGSANKKKLSYSELYKFDPGIKRAMLNDNWVDPEDYDFELDTVSGIVRITYDAPGTDIVYYDPIKGSLFYRETRDAGSQSEWKRLDDLWNGRRSS